MSTASSVWHRPEAIRDGALTHALVIGTSLYDHLPRGNLGLRQLDCAASAAYRFALWLKQFYRNSSAPLGSIRGLASPSDRERELFHDDDVLLWPTSSGDNVQDALENWGAECAQRPGNVAILYICGHGILESPDHVYVLLRDAFRNDNLANSLSIAPTQAALGIHNLSASLLFVDACQQLSPAPKWDLSGGRHLASPREAYRDSRTCYPIYYSSSPGSSAFGVAGTGTFFCQALLRCFDTLAVRPIGDPPNAWVVTTTTLGEELTAEVSRLHQDQQVLPAGGMRSNQVHQPDLPPTLPLKLRLRPAESLKWAQGRIKNKARSESEATGISFPAIEFEQSLACGSYALHVSSTPPPRFNDQIHHFKHSPPAGAEIEIDLEDR